ncbi:MAG: chloride channel protein [Rhodospirillales bacterium]|nr:chloride channel protein [Rhodospirillales bacterium]
MAIGRITISRGLMWARRVLRNDQLILAVLAVFVGACSGGAIILFREGISQVQSVFYGTGSERLYEHAASLPWWWILLAPTVGGVLVGLTIHFLMRRKRPSTVADVIAATAMQSGRMSLRRGLKTAIVDCLSIGVGASVGREGPAVHLGASLGGYLAKVLHLTRSLSRTLMGCGVAAAVAASFNAPIAGALFANEVIIGHYGLSAFAPIVISSVVGTMVSHAYFGDFPAFIITQHAGVSFVEMPAFAILGLLAAASAIGVMNGVTAAAKVSAKLPGPVWLRPGVGGFLVGGIAIFIPHVLGLGYGVTDDALKEALPWAILLAAFVGKLVATTISIGFGFGGGIFSAALCIGAMLGGVYGVAVTSVFPAISSGADVYTVVGMGAVAAAVLGAPISTTLIIFEMTGDYGLTVAVMIAVVLSSIVTKQVTGHNFFTWQLAKRGLDLRAGFETTLLRDLRVRDVMASACARVGPEVRLPEIRKLLPNAPGGRIFVVDEDDGLVGTITLSDLADFAFDGGVDDLVMANDIARRHPPVLAITDDLEHALQMFGEWGEEHVAVVDSADSLVFHGCVHEKDVIAAYNRALVETRREEHE